MRGGAGNPRGDSTNTILAPYFGGAENHSPSLPHSPYQRGGSAPFGAGQGSQPKSIRIRRLKRGMCAGKNVCGNKTISKKNYVTEKKLEKSKKTLKITPTRLDFCEVDEKTGKLTPKGRLILRKTKRIWRRKTLQLLA